MATQSKITVPVVVHVDLESYAAEYGDEHLDRDQAEADITEWIEELLLDKARVFSYISAFKVGL